MMAKAIGVGGIFIHLKGNQKDLFNWYEKNLGMVFSAYGSGFLEGDQLMIITFKRDDNPHMPYLNLRVDDIDTLIKQLKKQDTKILSDVTTYDYGKFATFIDPFDNVIELWEADKVAYKKMVEKEIRSYKKDKKPMV